MLVLWLCQPSTVSGGPGFSWRSMSIADCKITHEMNSVRYNPLFTTLPFPPVFAASLPPYPPFPDPPNKTASFPSICQSHWSVRYLTLDRSKSVIGCFSGGGKDTVFITLFYFSYPCTFGHAFQSLKCPIMFLGLLDETSCVRGGDLASISTVFLPDERRGLGTPRQRSQVL